MVKFRLKRIKHFFIKRMKGLNLSNVKSSEVLLLIAVITMIFFKYSKTIEPGRLPASLTAPLGDFGPSPYENYINSKD